MIDEHFKRIDTSKIAPFFLEKCKKLVALCKEKGKNYHAISGFRSPEEQDKLYAIGRTVDVTKPIVTYSPAFKSFHNFGLAIDFCLDANVNKEGLQPTWNIEDYKTLADEALPIGLAPAYLWSSFREGPHVQLPFVVGSKADMEVMYKEKGLEAVWESAHSRLRKLPFTKKYWL